MAKRKPRGQCGPGGRSEKRAIETAMAQIEQDVRQGLHHAPGRQKQS
ncbi:MAG: hypothetical protein ACLU38_01560 [Dysosmobacter sp.]